MAIDATKGRLSMVEQWAEKFLHECKHFNGIQHDTCKAGVRYDDIRNETDETRSRFPCLVLGGKLLRAETCKALALPTPEEARAEAERTEAGFQAAMERLASGKCITCGAEVKERKRVGRCEYAGPCGHRQGQVGDDDEAPSVPR